jgi:8-oxo-dGTP diphosphatase
MSAIKVVTALVVRDGAILMCQRHRDKYLPLHWEFPGGKVEQGETFTDALLREVKEELHLDILSHREYFRDIMTYSNGHTYDVTFYIVDSFEGEPVNTEFEDIMWVTPVTMPALLHLAGNKNIIEKLLLEGIPAK